jgi:N utilization substance protein A
MILSLGEKGVKTHDDFADLAADELREIVGETKMTESQANALIMAARASWFTDEQTPEAASA